MYKQIMVPVDLTHIEHLDKALQTAADLSKHYDAPVTYVGVTPETPSPVAHNPQEFAQKLEAFAQEQANKYGHQTSAKAYASHDPAIDINDTLLKALHETGADLVVMQSHIPNVTDYIWPSHGGSVASHADASVFLVR
ncbi:universal stress protein [Thiohalocapsa sp.]|uniref:universal stress protein n=1 Tax=Thiohalocapsa sp. TaxID=2497641 RepID=UPI0025F9CB78|nr:universal stress protein [Thiohalocapsa sp.]